MTAPRTQPFLRHALVYGLGSVLLQAAGILLLPLYTRCLSPAEFGALEVFARIGEMTAVCLLFTGLRQAVLVVYSQSETDAERQAVGTTTAVMVGGCMAVGTLLVLAASLTLTGVAGFDDGGLLVPGVLAGLLEAACLVLLGLAQARTQSIFFVVITLGQFLIRVALCVLLVVGLGWGARGVLLASLGASGACAVALAARELCRSGARVDPGMARDMLRFSLPFLLCGVGFFVIHNGDRFFLLREAGPREVGLYSFGYKLAAAVMLFTRMPLLLVWGPWVHQLARRPDATVVFGRAFTRMQATYVFVGLGLCLLVDEGIALVGGSAYAEAAGVVPVLVLAYFFLTAADLMDGAFYLRRRSDLKSWAAMSSTALILVLYALLIPRWGAAGAAWATLAGLAGHAVVTGRLAQGIFPVRHELGRQAAMLVLAAVLWLAARPLPATAWAVPVKVGLWALWPLVLWRSGVVSAAEKAWAREAIAQAWALLRGTPAAGPAEAAAPLAAPEPPAPPRPTRRRRAPVPTGR
jgi:O-antigen/teichoic acid export membrane protein